MALFGYPAAHENDAERAARAGLSTQPNVGRVAANTRMSPLNTLPLT
jgi:hypothetical protein